jgi:pSer/pThr/pTyr-binding forkhead associated (FHA) protein
MAVFLVPIEAGRPIVLDKAIVLIGRQADCDVVLTNSRRVSRRHCCVAQVNDTFVLRDLGSMNGVRINGRRVDSEARISLGDVVSIGDLGFVLQGKDVRPPQKQPEEPSDRTMEFDEPAEAASQPPLDLSQEIPVALPDSRDEFAAVGYATADSEPLDDEPLDGDPSDSDEYTGRNSHFELLSD